MRRDIVTNTTNQTQDKMRVSVTKAAVEWTEGKRSAHSLKTRVQYWLRKVASAQRPAREE